ncbi:MAG: DUF547 domain-containing protein [Pseudomonadota bacterium]
MKNWILTAGAAALLAACTSTSTGPSGAPRGEYTFDDADLVDEEASAQIEQRPLLPKAGPGEISIFVPKARQTNKVRIDYAAWDDILGSIVFNMGPSTRQTASTVRPTTGTRFVLGHESPFRLEGNRVFFSFMNEEVLTALREYRADLINIGDRYDISGMARNEQLAYWINLHNVLVIETIAANYPVKQPSRLRIGEERVRFDDAKIATLRGVQLSLKDIRTRIIYPNWKSPEVIYGFFRGDIGGPRIASRAFTASNVSSQLIGNANEFVNALRGVSRGRRETVSVSRIFEEARPYYFREWPDALKDHLRAHMREDVQTEVNLNGFDIDFVRYEETVADLAGGEPWTSLAASQVVDAFGTPIQGLRLPAQISRLYRELDQKLLELNQRGWARGRVVIEDIPTIDEDVQ